MKGGSERKSQGKSCSPLHPRGPDPGYTLEKSCDSLYSPLLCSQLEGMGEMEGSEYSKSVYKYGKWKEY